MLDGVLVFGAVDVVGWCGGSWFLCDLERVRVGEGCCGSWFRCGWGRVLWLLVPVLLGKGASWGRVLWLLVPVLLGKGAVALGSGAVGEGCPCGKRA